MDVDDCSNAARHLVKAGLADPARLCIDGGSAGGYTTLACLAFRCARAHLGSRWWRRVCGMEGEGGGTLACLAFRLADARAARVWAGREMRGRHGARPDVTGDEEQAWAVAPACTACQALIALCPLWCSACRDVFSAGASHYGVADLELLAKDTHKFESRCECCACRGPRGACTAEGLGTRRALGGGGVPAPRAALPLICAGLSPSLPSP